MKEKLKKLIKKVQLMLFSIIPIYIMSRTAKKNIFLMYTPVHANMGDQAIRKGEKMFLKHFFDEYSLIEISEVLWNKSIVKSIKKIIRKKDLIMIHGGGYIGDLWIDGENDFKHMIESFPENKIIVLSNTAYYSDTPDGRRFLAEDMEFYKKHKNVLFFLRDKQSYSLMCDIAGAEHCSYKPDMALMLNPGYKPLKKDILICTRHDHEKVQSEENIKKLKKALENSGYSVKYTDTVKVGGMFFKWSKSKRDKVFEATMEEFAGARLIITDRLHGMVLSAINKTPCIAMDNVSKKVSGVYEWLKHLNYVRVMELEDIDTAVIEALLKTEPVYNNDEIMKEFAHMASKIKDYWEN